MSLEFYVFLKDTKIYKTNDQDLDFWKRKQIRGSKIYSILVFPHQIFAIRLQSYILKCEYREK